VIVSVVNHKGGTGKTTTTINLGSALALQGYRILLIDFDAQGSLTYSLGIDDFQPTIADVLLGEKQLPEVLQEREGMSILPGGTAIADVELAIAQSASRFDHLQNALTFLPAFDLVLIDCPPSLSLLTLNALAASTNVLIPMQLEVLALRGLEAMLETIRNVNAINPGLALLGVLPIMVDPRKNIHQEVLAYIKQTYQVHIFNSSIRSSVKAAEAPSFGKSVVHYSPMSTTAADYQLLANEVLTIFKNQSLELKSTI
jgi:chromosome partitioning protein